MTPEEREAKRRVDLDAAVRGLTIADAVGVALRDHRRRLGLTQRAYAAVRGRPSAAIARLESSAGDIRLDDVVEALKGTGFALALVQVSQGDSGNLTVRRCETGAWPLTELPAHDSGQRTRDRSRPLTAPHDGPVTDGRAA